MLEVVEGKKNEWRGAAGVARRAMSTLTGSHPQRPAAARKAQTEWLRARGEHAALAVCAVSNLVIVALAVALVLAGSDWLAAHPVVTKHSEWVRAVLLAAVVALPALPIGRHIRIHTARTSGVRVGPDQLPELHEQLVRACRMLGIERLPELYISRSVKGPAEAYSVWWGGGSVVVLNADLFTKEWRQEIRQLTFVLARALGAIRLGHTSAWVELLEVYTRRVPGLRTPLELQETYSRDRCAAFVVPDGVSGLLLEGVGKNVLPSVAIRAFVDQTQQDAGGIWNYLAAVRHHTPQLAVRVRALYDGGFFDRERDRERTGSAFDASERGPE